MTFPLTEFSSVSITQVVDVRSPKARYSRSRVEGNEKPYWLIQLTTIPLSYAQGMAAAAYLDSLKGGLTIFPLPNPIRAVATRAGLTSNAVNASDTNLADIAGFTLSQVNAATAGDFIQYANHSKVYRIVQNQDSDSSGELATTITPQLFASSTVGEAIKYGSDVVFQVCLDDYVSMDVNHNNSDFIVFNLTLIEQG